MIVTRTPFRISLFGGGTDFPDWFRNHGGAVLGMAIDKYCYLSVRVLPPFFEHRHRIVYSKVELVNDIESIRHPAVRGALGMMNIQTGIEIHHDADLPARSGLGSSSSFSVGLLHALHALRGEMVTKRDLCNEAIYLEQEVLKESVGCQDQVWASFGGFNRIDFPKEGNFRVTPIVMTEDRRKTIVDSVMFFFSGFTRFSSEIAAEQLSNMDKSADQRHRIHAMVDEAAEMIGSRNFNLREFGSLLHESWTLKKKLGSNVSTSRIDEIYDVARSAGAYGGKLLGAGGGGFIAFIVEPGKRDAVRKALSNLIHVSVGIDTDGTKIAVYEPNGLDHV
jgi:D-glycero-alpha-D-manno-heptose-7-phosphate kinase